MSAEDLTQKFLSNPKLLTGKQSMRFFWDTQYYMDAQQLIFPSKLQTDRYSFHNVTTTSSIPFKHKEEHRFLQHYPFTVNFLSHGKSHINTFVIKHV